MRPRSRHFVCLPLLSDDEEFAQCSREKLSQILADNAVQLRVEMAAFMELEQFVKTTYTLEGDGTLIFIAYEKLLMLKAFIQVHHFPTLTMTVQELFPANAIVQQQWYQYGLRECLTPAFEYYAQTLANDVTVSRSIEVFQAAQLFCPKVVTISRPNAAEVEKIRAVPFLGTNNIIQALQVELAAYLVKADQIPHDFDTLSDTWPWWRMVARELPSWSSAVQKLVLDISAKELNLFFAGVHGANVDHLESYSMAIFVPDSQLQMIASVSFPNLERENGKYNQKKMRPQRVNLPVMALGYVNLTSSTGNLRNEKMPLKRRNNCCDRERLLRHLQKRSYICYQS
ncbi:hypothetical protein QZH41_002254, partial [Actinostola sp. cb2023]